MNKMLARIALLIVLIWLLLVFGAWLSVPHAVPPVASQTLAHSDGAWVSQMAQPQWNLDLKRPWVTGSVWHTFGSNSGPEATPRIYVRLAFYDLQGLRHGFQSFTIEPLRPGEGFRLDGDVPRVGDVSAQVYAITDDRKAMLEW